MVDLKSYSQLQGKNFRNRDKIVLDDGRGVRACQLFFHKIQFRFSLRAADNINGLSTTVICHLPGFSVCIQKIEKGRSREFSDSSDSTNLTGKKLHLASHEPETRPHEMIPEANGSVREKVETRVQPNHMPF